LKDKIRTAIYILKQSLRFSPLTLKLVSTFLLWLGILCLPISRCKAARYIMASHRNCFRDKGRKTREAILKRFNLFDDKIIMQLLPEIKETSDDIFRKCFITLKEKTDKEKGVILLKYLDTYVRLEKYYNVGKILSDYEIVLELSYYGSCRPEVLQFLRYLNNNVFVGLVEDIEIDFIKRLNANLIPVDFSSSTWVDDRVFVPSNNNSKIYDCIMVGTWDPVKRHHLLFKAISKINDPEFKAAIVGVAWGGTREKIEDMISYYGLKNRIDLFENASVPEVNNLINQSKVLILASLKEGGNKSIIESMIADTPVIVLSRHIGINHSWINKQTGMKARPENLHEALTHFRTEYANYSPRKWALENISCKISTAKLESAIKNSTASKGELWQNSLAVKVNRGPIAVYYDDDLKIQPFDLDKYLK